MAMVTISARTAKIIEDQLINYNEDNGSYTDIGIPINDLPRLLVRAEYLTSSAPEELTFSDIFYDDITVFQDMDSIKEDLMGWYRGKYAHDVALFDNISDSCVRLSNFQVMPRYLKSGDVTKFMIGFKPLSPKFQTQLGDFEDLVKCMDQLKTSNRIPDNVEIKRFIIGVDDYLESFPKLKQMQAYAETMKAQNEAMKQKLKTMNTQQHIDMKQKIAELNRNIADQTAKMKQPTQTPVNGC